MITSLSGLYDALSSLTLSLLDYFSEFVRFFLFTNFKYCIAMGQRSSCIQGQPVSNLDFIYN